MLFLYILLFVILFSVLVTLLMKFTLRLTGRQVGKRVSEFFRDAEYITGTGTLPPAWGVDPRNPRSVAWAKRRLKGLSRFFSRTSLVDGEEVRGEILRAINRSFRRLEEEDTPWGGKSG